MSPLPEGAVGHAQAVWTIGRLEAALALNNERVLEILPEVKVEDSPLREFALAEVPRMIELFDVSDCLEILSRMGEPDLLSQSEAALRNLQATSYSDYVIEHRRIQLLSQSPEENDRALAIELAEGFTQRPRPTVGLYAGSFDDLKLGIYCDSYGLDNGPAGARSTRERRCS